MRLKQKKKKEEEKPEEHSLQVSHTSKQRAGRASFLSVTVLHAVATWEGVLKLMLA